MAFLFYRGMCVDLCDISDKMMPEISIVLQQPIGTSSPHHNPCALCNPNAIFSPRPCAYCVLF